MGNIKKIGEQYYIEFYARGLMYAQVAGNNEEDARKLLEATEAKIAAGEMLTVVREVSFSSFFDQFLNQANQDHSLVSQRRFKALITHFTLFLNQSYPAIIHLSQITPKVIESYKAAWVNQASPRKINLSILLLREIMEHGIKLGFINDNPTIHVTLMPWEIKSHRETNRLQLAKELFAKSVSLGKIVRLLKLNDVGKVVYFSNLIPLSRLEMYN